MSPLDAVRLSFDRVISSSILVLVLCHAQERLSPQEMTYAREYFVMMGRAFKDALLDHLPACVDNPRPQPKYSCPHAIRCTTFGASSYTKRVL